jgi:uncharacterized repeat protein (TIGR03803 family)
MKVTIEPHLEHLRTSTTRKSLSALERSGSTIASTALVLLISLAHVACGGSGGQAIPPPPTTAFFLQAIPEAPLMTPGSSFADSVSAMPLVGSTWQGTIAVSISGLPSGLTTSPSSFSAGPGTYGWFPVTITADASLPNGVYPFTVTGTSGSMSYSMKMAVGVVQPPPPPTSLQSQVIYSFSGQLDGGGPSSALIADSAGNLYGTTFIGGAYGTGVVFEFSFSNGAWHETVLHSFGNGTDGAGPIGGLIFDASGNLYGVTRSGGTAGFGTVYELTSTLSGWQETVLHNFAGGTDGENSAMGVVLDKAGNLYGTTEYGGSVGSKYCPTGCGTVFQLARSGNVWNYSVIHNFEYYPDGNDPGGSGLVFDAQGNLYGTTFDGGSLNCPQPTPYSGGQGCGVVFKMTQSGGAWQFITLHTFQDSYDGLAPSGLLLDSSGNLYLTSYGGFSTLQCDTCGNFFELTPSGTLTELYYFWGDTLGYSPGDLVRDQAGNFYGIASGGPNFCEQGVGCGTVFRLSQTGQNWEGSGFYDFPGGTAGWIPSSVTVVGNTLYGTTQQGGGSNYGVVFEIPLQ